MATHELDCYLRDAMSDAFLSRLFKTAPQVVLNPRARGVNPFSFTDRSLVRGDLKEGLMKIRLDSSSDTPLPKNFTSKFAEKDIEAVFKGSYNEPSLKMKLYEVTSHPVVKNRVYRRSQKELPWTGTVEGLLRSWQDNQLLHFNDNPLPQEELASIFRNFRRNNDKAYPYVTDWGCSLFRIHHVDHEKPTSWQEEQNFGVRFFSLLHSLCVMK
jgi:hypothetical protein